MCAQGAPLDASKQWDPQQAARTAARTVRGSSWLLVGAVSNRPQSGLQAAAVLLAGGRILMRPA